MDRPERAQPVGDASRRCTPGATPEPQQAVFRGRQVTEVPGAGPSPSRTEPQAAQASAEVSGSPGGPVFREAGRVGRRFQPYAGGDPGRRPGAFLPTAGAPSVPPVPQGGRQQPELPATFNWYPTYSGINVQNSIDTERGDIYAAAASASALREIDQAVMHANSTYVAYETTPKPENTRHALQYLWNMRHLAKRNGRLHRAEAIRQSLAEINRLTHAKSTELALRRDEFRAASFPRSVPVPGREALEEWLRAQAAAVPGTDKEHAYFTHLAQELPGGRDPWTVSREFMGGLPSPGGAQQTDRVVAAHERLVRAIARGLSERRPESAGPEPQGQFKWLGAFVAIEASYKKDARRGDIYAAAASAAALDEIRLAVTEAYFAHRLQSPLYTPSCPPDAMNKLRAMRCTAMRAENQPRTEAIERSLHQIVRLTHALHTELDDRHREFALTSLTHTAPAPDPAALEAWLWTQANAAPGTDIEHSYFTRLAQKFPSRGGRDPWTASRELVRSLPGAGDEQQVERLRAAHRCLVQAMAGSPSQQAAVPAPGVAQAPRQSGASASVKQNIVDRLNSRNKLTEWQVRLITSAVARAIDDGELGVSTSRPQVWAKDLVRRVQTSILRPFGDLTESERDRESSDLQRLCALVEKLDGQGYL